MPGEAWLPPALEGTIEAGELGERWSYVVVDEIVGGRVGLSIAPWPRVDDAGRLRFADADADELVGVTLESLQALLRERRVVPRARRVDPPRRARGAPAHHPSGSAGLRHQQRRTGCGEAGRGGRGRATARRG